MNLNRSAQQMFEDCLGDRDRDIVSKIIMPIHQNITRHEKLYQEYDIPYGNDDFFEQKYLSMKCHDSITAYKEFETFIKPRRFKE